MNNLFDREWIEKKIKAADIFTKAIHDQISDKEISQKILASILSKSEAQISCILHPLHQAEFSVRDLVLLLPILDYTELLRILNSSVGLGTHKQIPGRNGNGKSFVDLMRESSHVVSKAAKALDDGIVSPAEAEDIRREASHLVGVINAMLNEPK